MHRACRAAWIALAIIGAPLPVQAAEPEGACQFQAPPKDGRPSACIRKTSFPQDLCQVMEQAAVSSAIPPDFLARLIWRESLFRPSAVSPKGAEGIAQFMPGTARLRGLANSFDPIAALFASASYLKELHDRFGNWGLAAAAYNAGEAGLSGYLGGGGLPLETRDYVFAITGHPIETWKERAPEPAAPPLDAATPFQQACVQLAMTRRLDEPVLLASADWAPWGVQLAAHYRPAVASRLFNLAVARLPSPLNAERAILVRQKGGNFGRRPRYAARIGRADRAGATELCRQIRAAGTPCTVLRN
jgi:soluble lytic murein transglycosylase-like protein